MFDEKRNEGKVERCPLAKGQHLAAADSRGGNLRLGQGRRGLVHMAVGAAKDRDVAPGAPALRLFSEHRLDEAFVGRIVAGAASGRDDGHLGEAAVGVLGLFRRGLEVDLVGSGKEPGDQMVEKRR